MSISVQQAARMLQRRLAMPRLGPLLLARSLHATIKELAGKPVGEPVQVRGWVLSVRPQKRIAFIDLTDGTTVRALQVVTSDPAAKTYASRPVRRNARAPRSAHAKGKRQPVRTPARSHFERAA